MSDLLTCFPPVADGHCRTLILGSMPGVMSLAKQQYYGHPQNQFWPMMFDLLGEEPSDDYGMKKAMMLAHHVALWDVVYRCTREGSLDTRIKSPEPNDFAWLFDEYSGITRVYFNGGKAEELYRRLVLKKGVGADKQYARLPSTSPAYTIPYAEKQREWRRILE